jgi:hypothetical protein
MTAARSVTMATDVMALCWVNLDQGNDRSELSDNDSCKTKVI